MSENNFKNVYFCILLPMMVAGIVSVGSLFMLIEVWSMTPAIFMAGCSGYLIGSLIRSIFKWEKKE